MGLESLRKQVNELRVDLSDRNYTLTDLCELAQREENGERVSPLPPWVEDALLTLMGKKPQASVQETGKNRVARPKKTKTTKRKGVNND